MVVPIMAQVPEIITGPQDQTMDEGQAVFMKCEIQFLDRTTHVVSFLLGSTIISDDGSIRVEELDNLVGDGVSERYQLSISIIPAETRIYVFELFIAPLEGVDNGGAFKCTVCPKGGDGRCDGNLENESRAATLEVRYRPDTTLYPKCINPSNSQTETIVLLGQPTTLTCESEIANPPVNLEWRKNSQIVQGIMPQDSAGMRRLDYEMTPVVDDEGSIFTCSVSSTYFNDLTDTECSLPLIKVASISAVTTGVTINSSSFMSPHSVTSEVKSPDVTDPGVPGITTGVTINSSGFTSPDSVTSEVTSPDVTDPGVSDITTGVTINSSGFTSPDSVTSEVKSPDVTDPGVPGITTGVTINSSGFTSPDSVTSEVTSPDVADPGVPVIIWIAVIAGLILIILILVVGGAVVLFCRR